MKSNKNQKTLNKISLFDRINAYAKRNNCTHEEAFIFLAQKVLLHPQKLDLLKKVSEQNFSNFDSLDFHLSLGVATPIRQEVSVLRASEIYGVSTRTIKRRVYANKLRPSRVSFRGNTPVNFYYLADIETLFASERQQ